MMWPGVIGRATPVPLPGDIFRGLTTIVAERADVKSSIGSLSVADDMSGLGSARSVR
jgi:hypothetical protein